MSDDPYMMEVALCDDCLSPAHQAPSMLDEIIAWKRRLQASERVVVCAPALETRLRQAVEAAGLPVDIRTSQVVQGNEVYVVGQMYTVGSLGIYL